MMSLLVYSLVTFLALVRPSSAVYCVCRDGVSDSLLQKNIDYACGNGADCSAILQVGACYQPNTVKDHCNYAVNSYFQRKAQVNGSCDFSGTATTVSVLSSQPASGCLYPSSPSGTTNTTTTTTTTGNTPTVVGIAPTGITDPSAAGLSLSKDANLAFSIVTIIMAFLLVLSRL